MRLILSILIVVAGAYSWYYFMFVSDTYPPLYIHPAVGIIGGGVLFAISAVAALAPAEAVDEVFNSSQPTAVFIGRCVAVGWAIIGFLDIIGAGDMFYQGRSLSFGLVIYGFFIWLPATIIQFIGILTLPFILASVLLYMLPYFILGVIAATTTTATFEALKDHSKYGGGERQIATAMKSDLAEDQREAEGLATGEISPSKAREFQHAVMKHRYKGIADTLKAQEEKIRAQTDAAKAAHEAERARRSNR